jgi:hypothetical protein
MVLLAILAACDRSGSRPPGTTAGAACPDGTAAVVAAPEVDVERWVPGTVVSTCADGPHAEDWPDGAPAARGARAGGRRAGTWTRWTSDGRFDGHVEHGADGAPVARREPSSDGRLVTYRFADGRVVGWRSEPAAPMPEWTGGVLGAGTRWAEGGR